MKFILATSSPPQETKNPMQPQTAKKKTAKRKKNEDQIEDG